MIINKIDKKSLIKYEYAKGKKLFNNVFKRKYPSRGKMGIKLKIKIDKLYLNIKELLIKNKGIWNNKPPK